jgi:hypothetical protein
VVEAEEEVICDPVHDEVAEDVVLVVTDLHGMWKCVLFLSSEDDADLAESHRLYAVWPRKRLKMLVSGRDDVEKEWVGSSPGDRAMDSLLLDDATKVVVGVVALVGVDKVEEGISDEKRGLLLEMGGHNRVKKEKLEVGIEEGPVCRGLK